MKRALILYYANYFIIAAHRGCSKAHVVPRLDSIPKLNKIPGFAVTIKYSSARNQGARLDNRRTKSMGRIEQIDIPSRVAYRSRGRIEIKHNTEIRFCLKNRITPTTRCIKIDRHAEVK